MSQKQIKKQPTKTETKEVEETPKVDDKQELKDELDELLDEIDGMLEENAEAFVKNYILEGRRVDLARTPGRASNLLTV